MLKSLLLFYLFVAINIAALAQQETKQPSAELILLKQKSDKDTSKVNLLLRLSEYYFLRLPRVPTDLDSALAYAFSAERLSNTLAYQGGLGNSYRQLGKIHKTKNDITKGKYFANKAIEVFKSNNYFLELGETYFDFSGYYSLHGNEMTEKIRIVEHLSLPAFKQAGSVKKIADVLKELGDLQQLKGDYGHAILNLKQALQLYQSIDYPALHGTYDLLGRVSSLLGNDDQAVKYGLLATQVAEQLKDTSMQLATIYNRLGKTYFRMKNYQLAYEYFQKSLIVAEKYKDIETILLMTNNISAALIESNRPRESLAVLQKISQKYPVKNIITQLYINSNFLYSYTRLKEFNEAQKYCNLLLELSENLDQGHPDQAAIHYPITEFYLATRQFNMARKRLAVTEAFFKTTPLQLARNHLLWFKLDSTEGRYKSAIAHYQLYKALSDSSLNETTNKHIGQLQIEYETEKKDNDIKLLENERKLQQNELARAKYTRNWILGAILLLLIITVLLINYSRLKQRTNKKLQFQQKEIEKKNASLQRLVSEKDWLVKEIHHRVKNNFHTVMGLLGTQSGYLKNEEAINAITDSQHRVHAMSLIHQKLYQSDNLSAINMPDYIRELVDYLRDSFNCKDIGFKLRTDRIELHLSQCIPLGLILNEAITNSIKYAFPDNAEGIISISLEHLSAGHLLLTIQDNGVGLPATFDVHTKGSMGMNLMQGLSEDIGGKFTISNQNGTVISIAFNYIPESTPILTPTHKETYSV
jgi:two-component sensor histidine kinase/tetratricopeptide (TPR) repeat protein